MTTLGKSIVGIIIIGLIALGGWYYTKSNNATQALSEQNATNTASIPSQTNTASSTGKKVPFAQFIKQGGTYKCTINEVPSQNMSSKGTVYVSGDNVKGEILTQSEGKSVTVNFIVQDGYTYTWTSMMPTMGFKFKNNAGAQASGSTQTQGNMWNPEQIGDYTCEATTVDVNAFVPPTTVKFTAY